LEASAPELEQKNGSRKPIVTRNAIIISLILIGILLAAHFFAFGYQNERIAFGQFVLVLVSLIVTQLEVRDKLYQGNFTFRQSFWNCHDGCVNGYRHIFVFHVNILFNYRH
jgi:hypothetical protein